MQSAISDLRREVQRTRVDVDGARDFSEREMARLRAENERLRAERDMEQYRTPRRVPSEPDIRIAASASPSRVVRSEGQVIYSQTWRRNLISACLAYV